MIDSKLMRRAQTALAAATVHGAPARGAALYRTIFVSDVHLGMKNCNADAFYDFLKNAEAEYLFLVGDIVDLWALRRKWHWPDSHNDVIRNILGKAKYGTEVHYIPGNHDEAFRAFPGVNLGKVTVQREYVHRLLDGRRLLVIHGDQFDGFAKRNRWLPVVGGWAYEALLDLNRIVSTVRGWFSMPHWSLSDFLKQRVKRIVQYVGNFERSVAELAHARGVDGIVCGHIHRASIDEIDGVLYLNDGDWVESCTALVEHLDGRLEIIRWLDPDRKTATEDREEAHEETPVVGDGCLDAAG